MRLRTIILLNLGLLFAVYTAIIFFLPPYVIKKDIGQASEQLQQALVTNSEHILRAQSYLFSQLMMDFLQTLNGNLDTLHQNAALFFPQSSWDPWNGMLQALSRHADVEFIEMDHIGQDQSAVLMPQEAPLHSGSLSREGDGVWIADSQGLSWPTIELPIPGTTTYYLLLPQGSAGDAVRTGLQPLIAQANKQDVFAGSPITNAQDDDWVTWLKKQQLLQSILPYMESSYGRELVGVAAKTGDQISFLYTAEAIGWKPLVPLKEKPPLMHKEQERSPPFFLSSPRLIHIYFAANLETDQFRATLGIPIDSLIQAMARFAQTEIWMMIDPNLWIGYHGDGTPCTMEERNQLQHSLAQRAHSLGTDSWLQNNQEIILGDNSYFYSRVPIVPGVECSLLSQIGGAGSMQEVAGRAAKVLVSHLSERLFLFFSIFGIVLVLFIFSRATQITVRPVNALSLAAKQVSKGQYDAVHLPNLGRRKDEIAQLVGSFQNMTKWLKEKEQIRAVLDKVVSKDIAEEILKSNIHLGGEDRPVSVLFADIRGFTHITRSMPPQEVIQMLNSCMTKLTSVVEGEGGVIDKYVGDCVMAIYGAPTANPDHAMNAVSSGLLMLQKMKKWNQERLMRGESALEVGIGINTGVVVAGNMGAEDRLNYTVLGSHVNLASRLCDLAEAGELLIGEGTYQVPGVQEAFHIELLGEKMLKGFMEPVTVYRVIDFKWTPYKE